jgi:hypothetical protein
VHCLLLFLYQSYSRVRANFCKAPRNRGFRGHVAFFGAKKNRGFVTVNPGFCYVKKLR